MESPKPTQKPMVGRRLAEDPWFAYNTLAFILPFLEVPDLLRCAQVCKMWQQVVKDPVFWRVVKIVGCKLDFAKMTRALDYLNTIHLSLRSNDCELLSSSSNTFGDISTMQALRVMELDECSMPLMDTLTTLNPNLEVMKVRISICKSDDLKLDLSFASKMPKLYELKLHGYRQLQGFQEFLATLNLKHLYLLELFEGLNNFPRYNWSNNTTLETLALGNCCNLSQFVHFLKSLTALKKLCLECCWKWDSFEVLKCVSEMNSITCLELLVVEIGPDFENGLKLCSNLKELAILPDCEKDFFDAKVALEPLKSTLKKLKWGFWRPHLSEEDNFLLNELRTVLPYTEIIATDKLCSTDIFK